MTQLYHMTTRSAQCHEFDIHTITHNAKENYEVPCQVLVLTKHN